jgi:GNAT superfamily N-acetyltransferase
VDAGETGRANVRDATPGEYTAVRSICNAAMLEVENGLLRRSSVLIAESEGRILGALVLRGPEIEAVAVRPGRRGQGLGTALVGTAARRRPFIRAGFDPAVRPFYASLGFEVRCSEGRCQGRLYTR